MTAASTAAIKKKKPDLSWRKAVAPYEKPDLAKSLVQIATSFVPYFALWFIMVRCVPNHYWITLALAPLAAGFLIRSFIVGHDCGHGSFFKSRKANDIVGSIGFTLAFVPYGNWRYQHAVHHATSGDLDHRDLGDVWTLTIKEYHSSPWSRRMLYRFYRFPLVTFILGPLFQFFIANRFWRKNATPKERRSIINTNIALAAIMITAALTIGFGTYLKVQIPVMMFAGTAGVWLFYVQHQFEGVYWERHHNWDFVAQAIEGSSYYKLPRVLQFFSGNIGFHHVHHLSPRIPNYSLERCHNEQAIFRKTKVLTLWSSFKTIRLRLWDEDRHEMVGFREARRVRA